MSKKIITEKELRTMVRMLILEDDGGGGYEGGGYGFGGSSSWDSWGGSSGASSLYNTFVKPFTKVLQATKLAGLDILNVAKLNVDTLWNIFNEEKRELAYENYTGRRREIMRQWAPIIKANQDVMMQQGAVLAFALNPGYFLGLAIAKSGKNVPKNVLNSLNTYAGIRIPFSSYIPGTEYNDDVATRILGISDRPKKFKQGLKDILGPDPENSSHWTKQHVDREYDDDKQKRRKNKDEIDLDSTFDASKGREIGNELMRAKEKYIETVLQTLLQPTIVLTALMTAKTYNEFTKQTRRSNSLGLDLKKIDSELREKAEILAKNEDYIEKITKMNGGKQPSKEQLYQNALNTIFLQNFKPLQEKIIDSLKSQEKSIIEKLSEDIPGENDGHARKALMSSPQGRQHIQNVDNAIKLVKQLFKNPKSIKPEQIEKFIDSLDK